MKPQGHIIPFAYSRPGVNYVKLLLLIVKVEMKRSPAALTSQEF